MHYLIRIISYGDTEEDAKENVQLLLDRLCGENMPFDWYNMEPDRYEDAGKTLPADSEKGTSLLEEGMKATKHAFFEAISSIRKTLSVHTTDQIWANECDSLFRYALFSAGRYCGPGIYVYDDDGSGIRDDTHYNNALTAWADGSKVWVTAVDMHS